MRTVGTTLCGKRALVYLLAAATMAGMGCLGQESRSLPGFAAGRIQVTPPPQCYAGIANRLELKLDGAKASGALVTLSYYTDKGLLLGPDSSSRRDIETDSSDENYIEFFPAKLGRVHIHALATFEDGKLGVAESECVVALPDRQPLKFVVMDAVEPGGADANPVYMDLINPSFKKTVLKTAAEFEENGVSVTLPAEDVELKIISEPGAPAPVQLDASTGALIASHIGHAVVLAQFRGISALMCIDVVGNARETGETTDCHELVPSGMSPPGTRTQGNQGLKMVRVKPQ